MMVSDSAPFVMVLKLLSVAFILILFLCSFPLSDRFYNMLILDLAEKEAVVR